MDKKELTFAQKASEYKEALLRLGRNIKVSDNLDFSDGKSMTSWLYHQDIRIDKILKRGGVISDDIKKQMEILTDIHSLVTSPARLSFEEKALEYHDKIYEIGRPITKEDHIYFSDHSNMGNWFQKQLVEYRNNARYFPYKYKRRFPILVELYQSIESLNQEKYDNYVSKPSVNKK